MVALGRELAEDFIHSSPGQPDQDRAAFLQAIASMPFQIERVSGEHLGGRAFGTVYVLSGIQRSEVVLEDGTRAVGLGSFVDVFERRDGVWKLCHAVTVELPPPSI